MNLEEVASLYRETSTRGGHPLSLVVKLYDAILEDLRRASSAVGTGDVQGRTASLNHALLVIAELQSVLDHDLGGEVSLRLDGFYNVTRALIMDANLHSTPGRIEKLIELYVPLRQAWKYVEQKEISAAAQKPADSPKAQKHALAQEPIEGSDPDSPNVQWNA